MLDVGVIGVGAMGQHHARILSDMKGVDNVYIYDNDHERADKIAELAGAKTVSSLDALFSTVSAVTIATPTKTHFDIAKMALEHGVHTLVEKPICKNTTESKELCLLSDVYKDLVCGVGHVERFNPVVSYLKNAMKNPHYINFTRHNPGSDRISDTNVVEDLMIHDIDLVNYLVNMKASSLTVLACGDDNTFVTVLDNDYPIVLSASRSATKKTRTVYVEDADYTIIGDLADQSICVYHKPETYTMMAMTSFVGRINLQRIEPLRTELSTFVECITKKQTFPIPFYHGHANLVLCNAILDCNCRSNRVKEKDVIPYDV